MKRHGSDAELLARAGRLTRRATIPTRPAKRADTRSIMTPFAATAAGALGLVLGSLLNLVAYPRSHCPGCEALVRPDDHVPVLSWLRLRGGCRSCHAPICTRYPVIEAGTALLSGAVVAV